KRPMGSENGLVSLHPSSKVQKAVAQALGEPEPTLIQTLGRRVRVEWDPNELVSPMGQLVYFAQFLGTAGLFSQWVKECPLEYRSPNAREKQDVLGTITLSILAGHCRYAHIAALRGDQINRAGFGMKQICSEEQCASGFRRGRSRALRPVAATGLGAVLGTGAPTSLDPGYRCECEAHLRPPRGRRVGL